MTACAHAPIAKARQHCIQLENTRSTPVYKVNSGQFQDTYVKYTIIACSLLTIDIEAIGSSHLYTGQLSYSKLEIHA